MAIPAIRWLDLLWQLPPRAFVVSLLCNKFSWRKTVQSLELSAEVTPITESDGSYHLLQTQQRFGEHLFRLLHSHVLQVLHRRLAGFGLEEMREVPRR